MVIHVVLFTFKADAEPAQIEKAKSSIVEVSERVPEVGRYLGGPNASPEQFGQGYDWGFVMTFADAAARDAYLAHPDHSAVHPLLDTVTEKLLVYDIEG